MYEDIIKKYGKDKVQNFWIFVDSLKFDSSISDHTVIKKQIIKKLSPNNCETYRNLLNDLAYYLFNTCYSEKGNQYLYASFDAISKGESFYISCLDDNSNISQILDQVHLENCFVDCFPIEDDYYNMYI